MSTETATASERLVVDVTSDRMAATLCIGRIEDGETPSSEEILAAAGKAGIAITDDLKKRVAEFTSLMEKEEPPSEPFVIAQGEPPFEGEDEKLVWDEALEKEAVDWQGDSPVNYYKVSSIVTVEEGTVIGTIRELVPPRDGVDVNGKVVKPKGTPKRLDLDKTIQRVPDDPLRILAGISGRVVHKGNKLHIDEVVVVAGDVSFETGNLDSPTDVNIKGMIPDRFEVRSKKSIAVGAAIEGATVAAEEDVVVCGGIVGRNIGRVGAGGEIVAKFCNEADLAAAGDIKVPAQFMNCRVRTNGRLDSGFAAVIGGHTYAKYGGDVATLGSEGFVPTRIFLGVSPEDLKKAADIEIKLKARREAVDRIRRTVEPLLQNIKRLAPSQREQATELMFKAEEAALQIADEEERRDELLGKAWKGDDPRLRVSNTIFPKVVISIGTRLTTFVEEFKGPVALEERKIKEVTEFVAVNQLSGSITILTSQRMSADGLMSEFEPLIAGSQARS